MMEEVFDRRAIVDAVREAFIAHSHGRFVQASPMHLMFPGGECHIKAGYPRGGETFTIKLASGFYANHLFGMPNGSGLQLLASQKTGRPIALFEDEGFLTAWRTAAAAVLAALAGSLAEPVRLGVVGAGVQGQLAALWLPEICPVASARLWGRDAVRTRDQVAQLPNTDFEPDLERLCRECNLIITTTPATSPLVQSAWIQANTHIVALGADTPGKVEIEPALFSRARLIITDDHEQCLDHGDFGAAVRAGCVDANADVALGNLLSQPTPRVRVPGEISIADLTGIAAQDHAITTVFYRLLSSNTHAQKH